MVRSLYTREVYEAPKPTLKILASLIDLADRFLVNWFWDDAISTLYRYMAARRGPLDEEVSAFISYIYEREERSPGILKEMLMRAEYGE